MADILSQEEIDALLDVVDCEDDDCFRWDNEDHMFPQRQITLYDFKRPNRVRKEALRALRGLHDKMCRNLAVSLSSTFKQIVEIQLHSIDQMTYGEFLMSLPNPTSFNIFKTSLNSRCVLEINPSIMFPMIDLLAGGRGEQFEGNREFSDIEISLMETFLRQIMGAMLDSWLPVCDLYPMVEEKESSPNVVQIVAQNEIVVVTVFEIIIGHSSGMVNICYPAVMLDKIMKKLLDRDLSLNVPKDNAAKFELASCTQFPVEVILDDFTMTLEQLNTLSVGKTLMYRQGKVVTGKLRVGNQTIKEGIFITPNSFSNTEKHKFMIKDLK